MFKFFTPLSNSLRAALIVCLSLIALPASVLVAGDYDDRPELAAFIDEMAAEHDFEHATLQQWFSSAKRVDRVIELMDRPAEGTLDWKRYRKIFITDERIEAGAEFWRKHRDLLFDAQMRYGVPASIIVSIIGVETYFGRISGGFNALDTLATLSFDYPRRAKFFRKELREYLLLARETGLDLQNLEGSYAAAFGLPQFISSSYREYAVDFDKDGKRDLWNSVPDAVGSVANYLYRHGWKNGQAIAEPIDWKPAAAGLLTNRLPKPEHSLAKLKSFGIYPKRKGSGTYSLIKLQGIRGSEYWLGHTNLYVITRYNHSTLYAMAVFQLGEAIRSRYPGL